MKNNTDAKQNVDRFLNELGEPVPQLLTRRAVDRVLKRLDSGVEVPAVPLVKQHGGRSPFHWSAVAAVCLAFLLGSAVAFVVAPPDAVTRVATLISGDVHLADAPAALSVGAAIGVGQQVRTATFPATIALRDGSRLEISPESRLSISQAADGRRVFLDTGTVVVTAARQRQGHLYVETPDFVVSVVGTVFSVVAGSTGSRVSVIEGEVHVQQGQEIRTLLSGQQASTSEALSLPALQEEIAFSPQALELMAMVQQSPPVVPAPAPPAPVISAQSGAVSGGMLRGVVRASTAGNGLAALVRLCPWDGTGDTSVYIPGSQVLPPRNQIAEIRIEPGGDIALASNRTLFVDAWLGGARAGSCPAALQFQTNETGRFEFPSVSPGQYAVRAVRDGYFGSPQSGQAGEHPSFASEIVNVERQAAPVEVVLTLIPGGTISGTVRDASGKPIPNTPVWAGPAAGSELSTWRSAASRTTDDRGEYRLFGIPPGEYRVASGAPSSPEGRLMLRLNSTGLFRSMQWGDPNALFFYRNGATFADATPVPLGPGEEVRNVDIVVSERPVQLDSRPDLIRPPTQQR